MSNIYIVKENYTDLYNQNKIEFLHKFENMSGVASFIESMRNKSFALEHKFKIYKFKLELDTMNVLHKSSDMTEWQEIIPKNTDYCGGCEFRAYSHLAEFFFGPQECSYCYYLGKGDFSYYNATRLLFDGCKECGEFIWDGEDEE